MENKINFYELLKEDILPDSVITAINSCNLTYSDISVDDNNSTILKILKKLDSKTFDKSGNIDKWEKGWSENLNEFKNTGDLNVLIPKYIHSDDECRLNKKYIKTENANLEMEILSIFIRWMMSTYLKDCDNIFEFGCGSAYNLTMAAQIRPNANFYGLDWAQASVDIISHIKKLYGYNINGQRFDIFYPDFNVHLPPNSGVFTVGCLEQVHTHFYSFVDFLFTKKPKVICHFEPILEFYDENNLLDYLSIKFHKQRNYLNGYYSYLKQLESENKIKILKSNRVEFGSLFQDSWSIIIWEII